MLADLTRRLPVDAASPAAAESRGMTEFRVWAPAARRVDVEVSGQPHAMSPAAELTGWWSVTCPVRRRTRDYGFRLDGGDLLADPRSLRQPDGPGG